MIWLLALACGDKDTDTTSDSSAVEDSDIRDSDLATDSDDPKDSGEPTECTLGAVSPLTIPIETEGTTVTVQFDCVPESVTLDGEAVGFEADGAEVVLEASGLKSHAQVLIVFVGVDGDHTTTVRGHSTELDLEKPADLQEIEGDSLLYVGSDSILTLSGGDLILTDTSTWKTETTATGLTGGVCQFGRCFAVAGYNGAIGDEDGTVVWSASEKETTSWAFKDEVAAVGIATAGPRALTRESEKNVVTAQELSTNKSWSLGALEGELALLEDTVVHASCERETLTIQDITWETGKLLSSDGGLLDCWPTTWKVQLTDLDGDGNDDQIHRLTYEDGSEVTGVRHGISGGSWGVMQSARPPWQTLTSSKPMVESRTQVGGNTWRSPLVSDGKTVSFGPAEYMGDGRMVTQGLDTTWADTSGLLVLLKDSKSMGVRNRYGEETVWQMATNGSSSLTRERAADGGLSYTVDGGKVTGLDDGVGALYGDTVAFFGVEDLLIDEREMTTGADWDYRVQPFGPPQDGIVALAWHGEDGLGLTYLDLDDPADDEGRLRKRPDMLTAEWDELIDQSIEQLQDNPLASMTPGDGSFSAAESEELAAFSKELAGPALVVTVPWDTGTECKLATVLLGGGDDVDAMWETAQVLSTGTDADCSDLAMPLGSADLFGDGGWSVVMSDGTAYRLNEFTIPEKVVMEKDGDFYGMSAGDLNGDGLGDAILYGDELHVWLSDGKGSSLAYEGDLPTWIWYPIAAGVSPGTGQPASSPMSWSVMVD